MLVSAVCTADLDQHAAACHLDALHDLAVLSLQRLRSMVHEIVGRINGRYGTLTENPIHHLDRQLSFHEVRTLGTDCHRLCRPAADCEPKSLLSRGAWLALGRGRIALGILKLMSVLIDMTVWRVVHISCAIMCYLQLCALYAVTDVALVTSLRDGMNLVSYEYVACQSENAGAAVPKEGLWNLNPDSGYRRTSSGARPAG